MQVFEIERAFMIGRRGAEWVAYRTDSPVFCIVGDSPAQVAERAQRALESYPALIAHQERAAHDR